nr:hypothetical protein MACL_00000722 [Theileria orientalis]
MQTHTLSTVDTAITYSIYRRHCYYIHVDEFKYYIHLCYQQRIHS